MQDHCRLWCMNGWLGCEVDDETEAENEDLEKQNSRKCKIQHTTYTWTMDAHTIQHCAKTIEKICSKMCTFTTFRAFALKNERNNIRRREMLFYTE
jgi:hypothetical protein